MRFVRNLALLAITALAALALSATSASAQVEVTQESTGEHCNPCVVQAHSESDTILTGHSGGFEVVQSVCDDEFTANIGEDGEGAITQAILTGPNCNSFPCATAAGQEPWPFHIREDGPGSEELEVRFCLFQPDGSFGYCTIHVELNETLEGIHHYELRATDENCHGVGENPAVEVDGHWLLNGEADASDVEIVHPGQ